MSFRFACKRLRADADRLAFWLSVGGELVLADGIYRLEGAPGDRRRPSPAPVPEALALEAIRAGARSRRDGDLFGGEA